MLGAYSPSPNVTDGIPLWIENLQRYLLPVIRDSGDASDVIKRWLELNAEAIVEMLRQDFNRKVPSRGLIPRIKVEISEYSFQTGSSYNSEEHRVVLSWAAEIPAALLKSKVLNDPDEFTSRFVAASKVGILLHESLHAMQMYHLAPGYRGREDFAMSERLETMAKDFLSYPLTRPEVPAYALMGAVRLATFVPQELYRPPNYSDIATWAYLFSAVTRFNLIQKVLMIPFLQKPMQDELRRQLYEEQYPRGGSKYVPYDEFLEYLKPIEALSERNMRRYLRVFQPINAHFSKKNLTTFKAQ